MARRMLGVCVILSLVFSIATAQDPPAPVIPNLLLEVSQDFANAAGSQVINKSDPFRTTKDRMRLVGVQQTNATVNVRFVPSARAGVIELAMAGATHADTNVQRRRVHL